MGALAVDWNLSLSLLVEDIAVGLIPHPVMGTTKDYCRYIKALRTPDFGAISTGGLT